MSRARDLLERFRQLGTPGPAGATGVPVDRARELAAELQPVLATRWCGVEPRGRG